MNAASDSKRAQGAQPSGATNLRIGDVAAAAGVSVDALRFYERRGLLRPAGRRASGYREYTPDTIRLVRFIRRAQALGFTLSEVEELVRLRERAWIGNGPAQVREAVDAKVRDIDRRLRELHALRGALGKLITACDAACASPADPAAQTARRASGRSADGTLECPLIEALETAAESDPTHHVTASVIARPPKPRRAVQKQQRASATTPSPTRRTP